MEKTKKSKKEVNKTTNETNVDVELTENELEKVSGGIDPTIFDPKLTNRKNEIPDA